MIKEDCSNLHELPNIHLKLGDHEFVLPPKAYVMQIKGTVLEADSVWDVLFFKPKLDKVNMCMPAFMQLEKISDYGPVWILGMPFLRYYYSTFNREEKSMYFARATDKCSPAAFPPPAAGKKDGKSFMQDNYNAIMEFDDEPDTPMQVDLKSIMPPVWDAGDTDVHISF